MPKRTVITADLDNDRGQPVSKKSRNTLDQSVLRSYGFEGTPNVVIANMDHIRFQPGEVPKFKERVYTSKKKVYTAKHKDLPSITFLGKEDDNNLYDYSLVTYNKTQKKIIDIKPASVLKFEGKTDIDPKEFDSSSVKTERVNYNNDFSIKKEEYLDKKRDVVSNFGTIRKNKLINAVNRRTVNQTTLETLEGSLAKTKNIIEKKEVKDVFERIESDIMPPPNRDAVDPENIYSKMLFYTQEDVLHLGDESLKFVKNHNSVAKLGRLDIPRSIAEIVLQSTTDDKVEAILRMKFLVYASICKLVTKSFRNIRCDDLFQKFPSSIVQECLKENFGAHITTDKKVVFTNLEKERLFIWFLCLWLVLSDNVVPLGSLSYSTGISETVAAKYLRGLGCVIEESKAENLTKYQSLSIARLVGQPPDSLFKKKRGKKAR